MQIRFLLLCVIALFILMSPAANAVDYTVRNLAVDVEGDNAIDAREKALNQARSNAFNVLKKRISDQPDIPTPDAAAISSMVSSFEINREKLSKNRYLASVNVTFNERAVQSYVGRYSNRAIPDYSLGQEPLAQNASTAYVPGGQPAVPAMQTPQASAVSPYTTAQSPVTESVIQVNVSNIRQWVGMKKMLETLPAIRTVSLRQLSTRHAIISVSHSGSINDLQSAVMGRGMTLYSNNDTSDNAAPYVLLTRG